VTRNDFPLSVLELTLRLGMKIWTRFHRIVPDGIAQLLVDFQ
jgi:hypothetical protein